MAGDRWRWALSSLPPLVPAVIHHLGLFFTYFICNIFRNFYSVNQPSPPPPPSLPLPAISIQNPPHKTVSQWTIIPANREGYSNSLKKQIEDDQRLLRSKVTPHNQVRGVTQACTLYAKEFRYGDPDRVVPPELVSLIYWLEIDHAKFRGKYAVPPSQPCHDAPVSPLNAPCPLTGLSRSAIFP